MFREQEYIKKNRGSGLGLYLTKHSIELLNGLSRVYNSDFYPILSYSNTPILHFFILSLSSSVNAWIYRSFFRDIASGLRPGLPFLSFGSLPPVRQTGFNHFHVVAEIIFKQPRVGVMDKFPGDLVSFRSGRPNLY